AGEGEGPAQRNGTQRGGGTAEQDLRARGGDDDVIVRVGGSAGFPVGGVSPVAGPVGLPRNRSGWGVCGGGGKDRQHERGPLETGHLDVLLKSKALVAAASGSLAGLHPEPAPWAARDDDRTVPGSIWCILSGRTIQLSSRGRRATLYPDSPEAAPV